ncbi:MAG: (2Fe-2S)-binding protein [Clostridia bacterium]|nr:(2Fe-2S)-binding protein [Clostridia bacterium]
MAIQTVERTGRPRKVPVTFTVNGELREVWVEPRRTLLDALRIDLGLTGTKEGCDHGNCGACTVIVNGRAIYSCLTLAVSCEGATIETIEGLSRPGQLHPIQQAFLEHDAFQCGYCTPGQIMSAKALLDRRPDPTADEIRDAMSGNLCRCGAYPRIVEAVRAAAAALRAEEDEARA